MRFVRLGLGVLSLACSSCPATPRASVEDESAKSGDASTASAPLDPEASQGPFAAPSVERACKTPVQRVDLEEEYHSTLESLCAALEKTSDLRCPSSRRALAASLVEACGPGRDFPVLTRRCGYDSFRVFSDINVFRAQWVFDSSTGALVGANVYSDEGLPCGEGTYRSGPDPNSCRSAGSECELCAGGPERDATCPPDVLEVLASTSCGAPPDGPHCSCGDVVAPRDAPFGYLPEQGTACGPAGTCRACSGDGTCVARCICALDGVFRWQTLCSE